MITKAYARNGDAVFPKLLGEFALVLWQSDRRTLTFVRSVDGARPLYYLLDSKRIRWASTFAHLARITGAEPKLNDLYLLEFLIGEPSPTHTPFANVSVVPPGTILRFVNDGLQPPVKLWNPHAVATITYRSDAEYEERLRHEVAEAVRVRLRANHIVFAELSGGLDSSSIVMVADHLLRKEGMNSEALRTLSCVYEKSATCDETKFIRMVEQSRRVPTIYVREAEQQITLGLQHIRFTGLPNVMHVCPGRYARFADHMREHGAGVLLTGIGGDHIFCSEPNGVPLVADSLWNGHFLRMHRECHLWSTFQAIPYFSLIRQAIRLILHSERSLPPDVNAGVPAWIAQESAHEVLSGVFKINTPEVIKSAPSVRWRAHSIKLLFGLISTGMAQEYEDLYVSHPYNHRPLLEFCLGIPISQLLQANRQLGTCTTRSVMRRAFSTVLPSQVAVRLSKGNMDEAISRAACRELHTLIGNVAHWDVCRRGYISAKGFEQALENLASGIISKSGSVFRVCMLERWLRSLANINVSRVVGNSLAEMGSAAD